MTFNHDSQNNISLSHRKWTHIKMRTINLQYIAKVLITSRFSCWSSGFRGRQQIPENFNLKSLHYLDVCFWHNPRAEHRTPKLFLKPAYRDVCCMKPVRVSKLDIKLVLFNFVYFLHLNLVSTVILNTFDYSHKAALWISFYLYLVSSFICKTYVCRQPNLIHHKTIHSNYYCVKI